MRTESRIMKLCRGLGLERVAWSLRRLHCPVDRRALVLEVGSGGNPYARADVLLDAYEDTRERHWAPLKADRPTVLGFVEQLPFRDRAFDFVIASHVLEHSTDPDRFLGELQRVARAGYIEVPEAFFERINPYRDHRLEITERQGKLVIRKKAASVVDPGLVELYEKRAKTHMTRDLFPSHPFAFHVRFYWQGTIPYQIVNPGTDAGWPAPDSPPGTRLQASLRQRIQGTILNVMRRIDRFWRRQHVDMLSLLRCPVCHHHDLDRVDQGFHCRGCGRIYPVRHGVPVLHESAATRATDS